MTITAKNKEFIVAAQTLYGVNATVTRKEIDHIVETMAVSYPWWMVSKTEYRIGHGQYQVPRLDGDYVSVQPPVIDAVQQQTSMDMSAQVVHFRQPKLVDESAPSVPSAYQDYVPFGFHKDLVTVIKSKEFYPVFITGLSGSGKTLMVEQVCAQLKRECIRVNISIETDESDLIGSNTLIDGNVVFRDGPVLTAMKRGAVLLVDEVDRGNGAKLMCLQGILEGNGHYNKKTGEMVYPKPGFTIIATANTKGKGSEDGNYLSQILDSAFLERWIITIEQEYPDAKTEKKILTPLIKDTEFVDELVQWADVIRRTYAEGAIDELISTRRLVHIAKTYNIFGDKMKAIMLCTNRFDEETKSGFLDLYNKMHAGEETVVEVD
jgi:AAA domain (dynein-related subfamily)/CbbQ/NirQ/NorQ C-terminal